MGVWVGMRMEYDDVIEGGALYHVHGFCRHALCFQTPSFCFNTYLLTYTLVPIHTCLHTQYSCSHACMFTYKIILLPYTTLSILPPHRSFPHIYYSPQILVYGDCAVNVSPSPEELAHIAVTSAETAEAFGISPARVALLSYSTLGSGAGPEVEKVCLWSTLCGTCFVSFYFVS